MLFYKKVFGIGIMYNYPDFFQVQKPGSKDIIVYFKKKEDGKKE
jgi:hypothetical protein